MVCGASGILDTNIVRPSRYRYVLSSSREARFFRHEQQLKLNAIPWNCRIGAYQQRYPVRTTAKRAFQQTLKNRRRVSGDSGLKNTLFP